MTDCIVQPEVTGACNCNHGAEIPPCRNILRYRAPQVGETLLVERCWLAHLEGPAPINCTT